MLLLVMHINVKAFDQNLLSQYSHHVIKHISWLFGYLAVIKQGYKTCFIYFAQINKEIKTPQTKYEYNKTFLAFYHVFLCFFGPFLCMHVKQNYPDQTKNITLLK